MEHCFLWLEFVLIIYHPNGWVACTAWLFKAAQICSLPLPAPLPPYSPSAFPILPSTVKIYMGSICPSSAAHSWSQPQCCHSQWSYSSDDSSYQWLLWGVQVLLDAKADINMQDTNGSTALHFSAQKGHLLVTKLLLAADAIASLVDRDGKTALDLALAGNHDDVCQLLLMHMGSLSLSSRIALWVSVQVHNMLRPPPETRTC